VQLDEYEAWLDGELKKQEKVKDHEDPVLFSYDVDAKLGGARKAFNKLKNKKKPRPPPPPAKEEDAAESSGEKQPEEAATEAAGGEEEARLEEGDAGSSAPKDEL
jgi:hypoxia up-regulated 1